jgi:hydroxyacylglutathione hydrolase
MTQIHTIDKGPIGANCYIIEGEARSVLIDPCVPFSEIPKLRSAIDLLIVTHCHYDHIAYIDELKSFTHAIVSAHESDFPAFSDPKKNASIYFSREYHYSIPDIKFDLSRVCLATRKRLQHKLFR